MSGTIKKSLIVGNVAELREALKGSTLALCDMVNDYNPENIDHVMAMRQADRNDAALAAPLRNCDVGTAEEQYDRFILFCRQHKRCNGCPFEELFDAKNGIRTPHICGLAWAQMPYEEGGAK